MGNNDMNYGQLNRREIFVVIAVIIVIVCVALVPDIQYGRHKKDDPDGDGLITMVEQSIGTDPENPDTDGDLLLDGSNVVVEQNSSKCREFMYLEILYRKNSNDTYIFFGEISLMSDPLTPSPRAVYQARFLSEIGFLEYQRAVDNLLIADYDWDRDFLENWFEVHKTETDYLVPNDRYVIWLATANPEDIDPEPTALVIGKTPKEEVYNFLVDWQCIPPENIKLLEYSNATLENIENAIFDVAAKADKDDFVYICLEAHGNEDGILLYDEFLNYENLDRLVDGIKDAKAVTVISGACKSSWMREPLRDGPCPRIAVPMYGLNHLIRRYIPEFRKSEEERPSKGQDNVPAKDDDSFVSIGEAARDEKIKYRGSSNYDIVDTHGLAFQTYFGDYIIGEKDFGKY